MDISTDDAAALTSALARVGLQLTGSTSLDITTFITLRLILEVYCLLLLEEHPTLGLRKLLRNNLTSRTS
jgi:hypothetical protein